MVRKKDDVLFTVVYLYDEYLHWKIKSEITTNNNYGDKRKVITITKYIFHFIIHPFLHPH
ncbi:MAG TPA: hypothetical protein VJ697_09935 [Nitrososphaeraceae archaeon]|nr:hypothetical protein [Nitrososphaeraceae archaeon]